MGTHSLTSEYNFDMHRHEVWCLWANSSTHNISLSMVIITTCSSGHDVYLDHPYCRYPTTRRIRIHLPSDHHVAHHLHPVPLHISNLQMQVLMDMAMCSWPSLSHDYVFNHQMYDIYVLHMQAYGYTHANAINLTCYHPFVTPSPDDFVIRLMLC